MFAMFAGLSRIAKIVSLLSVFVGIPALLFTGHKLYSGHYYKAGVADEKARTEAENARLIERGNAGRSASDVCFDTGGVFNNVTAECER